MGKNEYLPTQAYNNYFYLANREKEILVLEGSAEIEDFKKDGNKMTAKVKILEDKTVLELPYVYYQGFKVTIDGSNVKPFESKNGFLSIGLNKVDKLDLKVEYTGTSGMNFSKGLSVFSFILFIRIYYIFKIRKKRWKSWYYDKKWENSWKLT